MMSLNTAFVKIYGELLAPYGYKKIKGRRPYFVKVVGNEIVHIISYSTRPSLKWGYKGYTVVGGVATVYRPKINLDITTRDNFNWMDSSFGFYSMTDPYGEKPNRADELYTFYYKEGDEASMQESVRKTFESTEEIMLSTFEKVTDLKTCMEYLNIYMPSSLVLYEDEEFAEKYNEYCEGLLNLILYSVDEYVEDKKRMLKKYKEETLHLIEIGKTGLTKEIFAEMLKDSERGMLKRIEIFKRYKNDPETNRRAMEKLERFKQSNTELLRSYGLDI